MLKFFVVIFAFSPLIVSFSQTSQSARYQPGTILGVSRHLAGASESDTVVYDVSVKVGSTIYTVLYAPPAGANRVEYSAGSDLLVFVGTDTLTFNSKLSGETEVPILRRESISPEATLDWSKAPSQYFSMKQSHLSEALQLNPDQTAKIKPILEQEAGEVGQSSGTQFSLVRNNWSVGRKSSSLPTQRSSLFYLKTNSSNFPTYANNKNPI